MPDEVSPPARSRLKLAGPAAAMIFLAVLAFAGACHNLRETFIAGRIYFVDGDCYARMTRARMILEAPGTIIHHHDFENFPEGVRSHTTAPFDYAIVLFKWTLDAGFYLFGSNSVLRAQTLDLAGALISPLLGALTCLYLGWWVRWGLPPAPGTPRRPWWLAAPLFFAICPILAHGDSLGRPDHQAAVILLLTVALTAELSLMSTGRGWPRRLRKSAPAGEPAPELPPDLRARRRWCLTAGIVWGLSLWISLFEPLLLCLGTAILLALADRRSLLSRERLWEAGPLVAIVCLMLLVEGSPIPHLSPEVKEYFGRWSLTVAELRHLDPREPLLYHWLGWGCLAAPLALIWAARGDRRAWAALVLLAAMFLCTWDHQRWGYFLGLAYALSLPWQMGVLRWRWLSALLLGTSFYPIAQEWDGLLYPEAEHLLTLQEERVLLRDLAGHLQPEDGVFPFLAPWWLSPALAYWSGQPGVAGSSHEGLPGIVDTARFFLSENPKEAAAVLDRRRLAFVVIDAPERLIETSLPVLNLPEPARPLARSLYDAPHSAPRFLSFRYANRFYKLFAVDTMKAQP